MVETEPMLMLFIKKRQYLVPQIRLDTTSALKTLLKKLIARFSPLKINTFTAPIIIIITIITNIIIIKIVDTVGD